MLSALSCIVLISTVYPLSVATGAVEQREAFASFVLHNGRVYASAAEYQRRFLLFSQRIQAIQRHNAGNGSRPLWRAAVNRLTDLTDQELASLRGRHGRRTNHHLLGSSLLQYAQTVRTKGTISLPNSVTWSHLRSVKDIQDQKGCGSCWAFATASVLRAHSEIYRHTRTFSQQELVSCVKNPKHCGGTGGCAGATSSLAMEYVLAHGLVTDEQYPYVGTDGPCPSALLSSLDSNLTSDVSLTSSFPTNRDSIGMLGWTHLPENQLYPVQRALVDWGPVAVSISATKFFNSYESGIMDSCVQDAVIDHAVMLFGYGEDNGIKYWNLQNSWSNDWGENGNIRILRLTDKEESAFCGNDKTPEVGSGCDGGPVEVEVCGSCGILYDAVMPHFSGSSFMARMMANRRVF